jgi:hypothetical protein
MDIHDPVTVYTLHDPVKAEIIRGFLQSEGIRCRLEGVTEGAFVGLHFSEISVVVPASDADRARKLIEDREHPPKE